MKLLLGNPGQPDAAITPDRVLEIDQDFQDFQLNDLLKLFIQSFDNWVLLNLFVA